MTAASTGIVARGMGSADVDSLAASNRRLDQIVQIRGGGLRVDVGQRGVAVEGSRGGGWSRAPNAARTVACQLLGGVVGKFGRYEPIARQLLDEVFVSVFVDPEVPEAEPYF